MFIKVIEKAEVYINGEFIIEQAKPTTYTVIIENYEESDLVIGPDYSENNFADTKIDIDDMKIWYSVMSAENIAQLYQEYIGTGNDAN